MSSVLVVLEPHACLSAMEFHPGHMVANDPRGSLSSA
jgi:hypothetical protein